MQATRGASLTSSDQVTGSERHRPRWVFAVVAVAGLAIDQISKTWALRALEDGDQSLIGDWFTLHLTFNPGAAFSTGTQFTLVFTVLAMAAVLVVLYLSRRLGSLIWALGLGLLLAGVSGNLVDRVLRAPAPLRGHVVDFLQLPNWPVFNFADVFINVAAAIIILQSFRGIALSGAREDSRKSAKDSS